MLDPVVQPRGEGFRFSLDEGQGYGEEGQAKPVGGGSAQKLIQVGGGVIPEGGGGLRGGFSPDGVPPEEWSDMKGAEGIQDSTRPRGLKITNRVFQGT